MSGIEAKPRAPEARVSELPGAGAPPRVMGCVVYPSSCAAPGSEPFQGETRRASASARGVALPPPPGGVFVFFSGPARERLTDRYGRRWAGNGGTGRCDPTNPARVM